jgi:hypothetical protein
VVCEFVAECEFDEYCRYERKVEQRDDEDVLSRGKVSE